LFNRHPEIPIANVSVPSRHLFDAVQFDKASFANVMKAGVSLPGFAGIPAWAYYPLFQVKMKIVEFGRSQFRYFYSSSRMQNRIFVMVVLDTVVKMILSGTISPDISKMNSVKGSVLLNPWESQCPMFQFKNDGYEGAGAL
jgi:hypothetical protein